MGVLTLHVEFRERGIKKTMQFNPRMVVYDACRLIRDELGPLNDNPNNYGLFATKCVWMENGRTLKYYLIRNGDTLEYKNKFHHTNGVTNGDKNGYQRDPRAHSVGGRPDAQNGKDKRFDNTFVNTIGRKKEKQIQQLRAKLHTDEEWVDQSKTLREQNIGENEELILRRKFFFSDTNVDTRDPVQLNLLYLQCRDGVLKGLHPVSRETAIKLAALQCYIEYGPLQEGVQHSVDAKNLLPKEYAKGKEHEKNIVQEYRELMYEDSAAPKKKYCELCQSLPTYGVTFFLVKEKLPGKNRRIPRLLGVNKDSVMRVDERTKAVLKDWPLEQVRRWAASNKTFTLDFGDYKDGYYSVQTLDGEKICQSFAGYIDIIMKKKRTADHTGIEGDEGSTFKEK
ncbi:FERM central domain-containing protein [Ditylenchus destructor]|uniref:FERM central domain-containing protein n=1 Tax=Ditylenchus destructor TaxID=166010 RepID=A0AAD4N0N7_9BILA|nr:FERM central domain-containing protein [Ditylenchus destructor]